MSLAVMTLMLAGTSSTRRSVRVPTTVTGATRTGSFRSIALSSTAGAAMAGTAAARAVSPTEIMSSERIGETPVETEVALMRTIIRINLSLFAPQSFPLRSQSRQLVALTQARHFP